MDCLLRNSSTSLGAVMKKQIGKLLGRFKTGKRRAEERRRGDRHRGLRMEALEGRRLLAADLANNHNYFIAEDVNLDFNVSPLDSLLVINALNETGARSFAEGEIASGVSQLLDVNGDNFLSPLDALLVVNRLNAEGEDPVGTFVSYSYQITTPSGTPIANSSVNVGDTFRINVFVRDVRPASARTITDPADPNYARFNGIYSAAQDLGVSDLSLVNFVRPSSFFSGVRFDDEFINDQGVVEGGGIQIGGDRSPAVADGQTFTITTATGSARFEFDVAGTAAVAAGNIPVSVRALNPQQPDDALSYNEVAAAMVTAIQGAGLGLIPVNRGAGIVGLPVNQFTLTPETSSLSISSPSVEYLNEVKAFQDRSRSLDPDGSIPFFAVDFTALQPGQVTFNPNGPDRLGSENLVFGSRVVIPNEVINFGQPFSVTINADPTSPVAVDDSLTMNEDGSLVIGANVLSNDTVTAPRTLSISSLTTISGVTVGTLNGNTYTPPADFFGTDRLIYVAVDSNGLTSQPATITITVNSVNDAPNAFDDALNVDEGSTGTVLNLLANNGSGADNAGPANETSDAIRITGLGESGSSTITTANGATVTIQAGGQSVLYTPVSTFLGTDTFTYTITDNGGLTDTATVTVEVAPAVLPRARRDAGTAAEGSSVTIAVLGNDSANPGATPVLKSFTNGAHGTVTRQSSDSASPGFNVLVYTPNDPEFSGSDSFTYIMNDSSALGADSTATVAITITAVNDTPVLGDDTASTNEDTALTIPFSALLANDSAGPGEDSGAAAQTLDITSVAAVTSGSGTVSIGAGNTVVYTPAADFNGSFVFTYTAADNGSPVLSATASVTITVAAVNDDPIAGNDTVNGVEDTALSIPADSAAIDAGNVLFNDRPGPATAVDEAGQTLTVTGVASTSTAGGTVSLTAGVISYTPATNFNGTDTFTYTLSDGAGGTATGTVTVLVSAVNDPPLANADSVSGFRDIPIVIPGSALTANDSPGPANESGQTLSVVAVAATANTNGQVVLNSDGTITFTPGAGFAGSTSFEYTLSDGAGGTATATVNVTVLEFVPSTLGGKVYADDNADLRYNSHERVLGGIKVVLTGTTAQGVAIAPQTQITLADGSYSFDGLGPGNYQVSYSTPSFLIDSPGPNEYKILVDDPTGRTISNLNFAVQGGIDLSQVHNGEAYQLIIDQFASNRYPDTQISSGSDKQNILGAYFVISADNTAGWSSLRTAGSSAGLVEFCELVLSGSGTNMFAHVSVVDSNQVITTRTLSLARREFWMIESRSGEYLIGIRSAPDAFQTVNRATPPISTNKYLDAVDAIFAQEGWD